MKTNVKCVPKWLVLLLSLFILNSCKKDVASTSQSTASTLASNSVLNTNGVVFASSNGLNPGTATPFPFDIGGEGVVGLNWDPAQQWGTSQLFCYTAGHGLVGLYKNTSSIATPAFQNVYWNRNGVTFWNNLATPCTFLNGSEKVVGYDMNGTGRLDYIICYIPGTGKIWIFHWLPKAGIFWELVYYSNTGIGSAGSNFDLTNKFDEIIPFDFGHTGKATGLMCYRPGTGKMMVFTNNQGYGLPPVYNLVLNNTGIGTGAGAFNLLGTMDLVIPWDVSHTGKQDGILAYRTGGGILATYTHSALSGSFTNAQYSSNGIIAGSNYDLRDPALKDRIIHYQTPSGRFGNYTGALVTRAGKKLAYGYANLDIYQNTLVTTSQNGIGDPGNPTKYYPLSDINDQVAAFDGLQTGYPNSLLCWRGGSKNIWIFVGDFQWVY